MQRLFLLIAFAAATASGVLAQDVGFDFRSTAGFVTDPLYAVPVLSESYPHTYTNANGVSITAGWEAAATCAGAIRSINRLTTVDPRIAGIAKPTNSATFGNNVANQNQCTFKVTLPSTGNWTIGSAIGDRSFDSAEYVVFSDGGTPFLTYTNVSVLTNQFMDTNGLIYPAAGWPTGNTSFVHTFTTTTFEVSIGANPIVAIAGSSPIAHLRLTSGGNVSIVVSPSSVTLRGSQTQTFTATQGGSPATVTWSCPGCAGSINSSTGVYTAPSTITANQSHAGCQIFPNDAIYNTKIDALPLNPNNASIMAGVGTSIMSYDKSIPYNVATASTPSVNVNFTYTPTHNGLFKIPLYPNVQLEGGWLARDATGDHHLVVISPADSCKMQEMYQYFTSGNSQAGIIYDPSSYVIPTFTTDAAGLPLIPLLLHLQEMENALASGTHIKHALRMTLQNGFLAKSNVWPATAFAGTSVGTVPYGTRFRMKSSFNTTSFSAIAKILLTQLKEYGVIIADGGLGWQITADQAPWPTAYLSAFTEIQNAGITSSSFESVDDDSLRVSVNSTATNNGERVVATSVAVPANTSAVSVNLQGVTIAVDKDVRFIQAGTAAQQFSAAVNGSATTTATWSMSPSVGTLTTGGLYTPPATAANNTVTTVTATSDADPTAIATMTITVIPKGIIRTLLGRSASHTDSLGNLWQPTLLGSGGGIGTDAGSWPATPDIFNYQAHLAPVGGGDWRLDISVPNGSYMITALFADPFDTAAFQRNMALETQGSVILNNVDVWTLAGGKYQPIDFSLPAFVSNGQLSFVMRRLYCTNTVNNCPTPGIQGLQVTPVTGIPLNPAQFFAKAR